MLRPALTDERVAVAAHDNRRLDDQRQSLLDPVRECRAGRRQERTDAESGVVACGAREQGRRLPRCSAEPRKDLVPRTAPLRIDRRTDEHDRADAFRPAHGELRDDLTAHRVRHERRTPKPGGIQARRECGRKICDAERAGWLLTAPESGQVRHEDGEGRDE